MGMESFDNSHSQETTTSIEAEKEMRGRIDDMQAVVDEDGRQVELAERKLSEARVRSEGDGVRTKEEIVGICETHLANKIRSHEENKSKLAMLREELRRSYH